MVLAYAPTGAEPRHAVIEDAGDEPMILNPLELRQLRQMYRELLDLHHAEVVDDEDFQDAHRLMLEQVLPLHQILREHDHLIVDDRAELTY